MLAVGFAANTMDKHKLEISGVQAGAPADSSVSANAINDRLTRPP